MITPHQLLFTLVSLLFTAAAQAQFEVRSAPTNLLDQRRAGGSAALNVSGQVSLITVRGGGGAYTAAPVVTLSAPPSGTTATATATISSGVVTKITINSAGSGYVTPPAVVIAAPQAVSGPAAMTPQYAGQAATSATSGAISYELGIMTGRYPRGLDRTIPSSPVTTVVMVRSSMGYNFASGAPLYSMGDEIQRPNVRYDGVAVAQTYWRAEPVQPGETFSPQGTSNIGVLSDPPFAMGSVTVTRSTVGDRTVTVSSPPNTLVSGASLLGAQVASMSGNAITLRTGANQNISAPTSVLFSPYQPYYYSPHAGKVFATQSGRVTITWVSQVPDTTLAGESAATYKFRREVFAVSSGTSVPVRTMYWTEKGFDAAPVSIPAGRIVRVNPIYNTFMPPAVATEYSPLGSNPGSVGLAAETRTLWYENQLGPAALRAYNLEGRIFIEYLGAEIQGSGGAQLFLGADIVDVKRVAEVATVVTALGDQLRPNDGTAQAGDELLIPSVVSNSTNVSVIPYGTYQGPDGVNRYYAERESLDPDQVTLYWRKSSDAAIYAGIFPPNLSVQWPVSKRNYVLAWPESLGLYQPVNVANAGNGPTSALQFSASSLPQLAFQDDPANNEARVDATNQRLLVNLSGSTDQKNRSLLKFTSDREPWYVRLFIQSEDKLGRPAVADPDGEGPLNGSPAVYTLNDTDGDGVADQALTATVGSRLEPPSAEYELAGYISQGDCYAPYAYANPFSVGFTAAASSGIIPVNALSNRNALTVWWFKKIAPPSDKYEPFYVPAIAARYTVSYPVVTASTALPAPGEAQDLILSSGKGLENPGLTAAQVAGSIYVQNDSSKAGFNPNEEHALMLGGNVYALRDDLNTAASSQPFVLISYTQAASGLVPARPAMRVARVLRSKVTDATFGSPAVPVINYPLSYLKAAGTPLQAPMPLTLLPLPLADPNDGSTVRNTEVEAIDNPTGSAAPVDYKSFTFEDRKGQHWLYRGPHNGGAPSFGMKFYYKSLDGFFVPGLATQPAVGTIMPFIASEDTDRVNGDAVTLTYFPKWPDDAAAFGAQAATLGVLSTAETLTLPKFGLPQVRGSASAQVIYQQSVANNPDNGGTNLASVMLHDPTRQKISALASSGLAKLPASVLTSDYAGRTYFQGLPPNLQNRFYFNPNLGTDNKGALVLTGEFVNEIAGEDYLNLNALSEADVSDLKALCPDNDTTNKDFWDGAIDGLQTQLETFSESTTVPGTFVPDPAKDSRVIDKSGFADIKDPDTAVDSYALSSTGEGTGYVTLLFNNGLNTDVTNEGNPVQMQIIRVSPTLYQGDLKVLLSSNPLDEQVVLRHSGDYGAKPENFEFAWRYAFPNSGLAPASPLSDDDTNWLTPSGTWSSSIKVGGSVTAAISAPAVLMGDTYFTMKYRKLTATNDAPWSTWMPPKLVEGWIKRVLAKITPFNQRMTDLYGNAINTDVTMLTQAGKRWEGDVALNLNNINDAGLIEIYETVLNRGKSFTIGSGIDFSVSNDALLLAAGYLNDLYTILGNEAYADAANPTISIDDAATATEVNTSRFSFEGQVANSLEEELGLLRGRDNFTTTANVAPAYNRLYWNYTRGINSGEALYATNYNIKEKTGSSTANGILDAADAYRMFPQGHGDAYGHYLTALTGYYKLLTHPDFTWIPRPEAVTVLGQTVLIDYQDERKFAAAAAHVATTAEQIVALVQRQTYKDDVKLGWTHFRDRAVTPGTTQTRDWGLDEWASRSGQGSFFHWVAGNSMLLADDTDRSGVQKIDRTTVPELDQLVSAGASFQTTMDTANGRLNPLGLSPGAIAFDISPTELQNGRSHYEQIADRALRSVLNAKGSFNQAARMTRLLRNQENQATDKNSAIVDQESAYNTELTEIFGRPYAGDLGPGKTYSQDYSGPDLVNWSIIDRPSGILVDTTQSKTVTLRVAAGDPRFTAMSVAEIQARYNGARTSFPTMEKTYNILPNQYAQYADIVSPTGSLGSRPVTGTVQQALLDAQAARASLLEANYQLQVTQQRFSREGQLVSDLLKSHKDSLEKQIGYGSGIFAAQTASAVLTTTADLLAAAANVVTKMASASAMSLPTVVGLANDPSAPARGAFHMMGTATTAGIGAGEVAARATAAGLEVLANGLQLGMDYDLAAIGLKQEDQQAVYEFDLLGKELLAQGYRISELMGSLQVADQQVKNQLATAQSLLTTRESFRQRAAAVISGYRTNDMTFRTFRNEALEQYRSLYDLASRYTYLAAKSYDYETGLLGTTQGQAVIASIVSSRALGDLTGDMPQATTSSLGDAGLAGSLAKMNADFSVVKGRLGINNPDRNGTLFSLRRELYRIPTDAPTGADEDAWQQTLEQSIKPNLMSDPDVVRYCNNLRKPDGSAVPGFIIPFSTTIQHAQNFFGLPLVAGDHAYTPSNYSTKISSAGMVLKGYIGMDPLGGGDPVTNHPNSLSSTPYLYLIPCGDDSMLAPPLGDTNTVRSWTVHDQALPLPYNLGASAFNTTRFFNAAGTLSEQPWIQRNHPAFRPVSDGGFFYSSIPTEFTNSRLVGRSVWNSQWKIVIPAYTLANTEQDAMTRFVRSVKDIQIFLRTYSNSGN